MTPTLTVVIPSYNESKTLNAIVEAVEAQKPLVRQIIVVNDGSSDSSRSVLDSMQKNWKDPSVELHVIHQERNKGKGAAIRAAVAAATQPYFLIQDADLELDPKNYHTLIGPVENNQAMIVFGNRFANGFPENLAMLSRLANWIITHLSNVLFGLHLKDQACGYKLVPTALMREMTLVSDGFEICSEMTAKLGRRHVAIANVPVSYEPRSLEQGKKIRWMDGFVGVYTLLKYRL